MPKKDSPLRIRRESIPMTRKELADRIGVSEGSITNWELGIKNPSLDSLKKLASFFNVDPIILNQEHDDWREEMKK